MLKSFVDLIWVDAMKILPATLLLIVCFSQTVLAGSQSGLVTFVTGQYQSSASTAGYTFFQLSGADRVGNPCTNDRWVIDNDWPAAPMQVATLQAAVLTGRQVRVQGSGNCAVWGDTETTLDVYLIE